MYAQFPAQPIVEAAAQGGKTLFCEKLLAMSVVESKRMSKAVQNVPTLDWFSYRRVPAITLAKRLVDERRVGHVSSITIGPHTCRAGDTIRPILIYGGPNNLKRVLAL